MTFDQWTAQVFKLFAGYTFRLPSKDTLLVLWKRGRTPQDIVRLYYGISDGTNPDLIPV